MTIRYFCFIAVLFSVGQFTFAQTKPATRPDVIVIRLWQGDAPGATGQKDFDVPTLSIYQPTSTPRSGAAMIVCPGGAYSHYGSREGAQIAEWLNTLGITAGILHYRLGSHGYRHPVEMEDAQRAIRTFRSGAGQWNFDPDRVGVIGFSAGGHLASTVATHFDDGDPKSDDPIERVSCRPDLALLIYPVITMGEYTHPMSRQALLGDNPDPKLIELLSNEKQVTANTPPCFLVHGADDTTAPVRNSIEFASTCVRNHVPVELHIFEHGRHGSGLGENDPAFSIWPADAALFLERHGFLKPPTP